MSSCHLWTRWFSPPFLCLDSSSPWPPFRSIIPSSPLNQLTYTELQNYKMHIHSFEFVHFSFNEVDKTYLSSLTSARFSSLLQLLLPLPPPSPFELLPHPLHTAAYQKHIRSHPLPGLSLPSMLHPFSLSPQSPINSNIFLQPHGRSGIQFPFAPIFPGRVIPLPVTKNVALQWLPC